MMNGKPLVIDGYCGLGGWSEGFLAEGWECVGFDIERHDYGNGGYPGHLVLQDMLTVHGSQFKDADCFVFSPPCQNYSYLGMPWSRSKDPNNSKKAKALRLDWETNGPDNRLFDACFRIQREACEAAGRYIPMVVENVCKAQEWVGRSVYNYGSFHLWGDVPALMPTTNRQPLKTGVAHRSNGATNFHGYAELQPAEGFKTRGLDWSNPAKRGQDFTRVASAQTKNSGGSWFNVAHNTTSGVGNNPVSMPAGPEGIKFGGKYGVMTNCGRTPNGSPDEGTKHHGSGPAWFNTGQSLLPSRSNARKAASAQIAKIPLPLSRHIARVYYPQDLQS